jgi:hypothetical protein
MRGIYRLVILAEELSAFLFGQIPQNDLGIIWFLGINRLGGHSASLRPSYRMRGRPAETRRPSDVTLIPGDEPGLLDLLAQGEQALPAAAASMEAINAVLQKFTKFTEQASEDIDRSDKAGKGSAGRLIVSRNPARNFTEPAGTFLDLANTFESQMVAADAAIKLLISSAPAAVDSDPASKPALCEFFRTTRTTAQTTNAMLGQYKILNDSLEQGESLSRDLRPILQQIRKGIATISAASSVVDGWVKAIDASSVKCDMAGTP